MPNRREQLRDTLRGILGTKNTYFQPPENVKMQYPAIVYELSDIKSLYANGGVYLFGRKYALTLIDKDPDSPFVDRLILLPTCRFVRHYKADRAIAALTEKGYEIVNTLFTDEWYSRESMEARGVVQIPLCFLAKSLENMANCHAAYFCKGWEQARGCRIEHAAAEAYGLDIIYE